MKRKSANGAAASKSKQLCMDISKNNNGVERRYSIARTPSQTTINENNNDVRNYYKLRTIKKTFNKKFNLHCHDHQAKFKNTQDIEPSAFPVRVHEIMDHIFKDVLNGSERDGRIRVCMDADGRNSA